MNSVCAITHHRYALIFTIVFICSAAVSFNERYNIDVESGNNIFSTDFVNFLRGMDLNVFIKREKSTKSKIVTTTPNYSKQKVQHPVIKHLKPALMDVLMLKLVSYYENKLRYLGPQKEFPSLTSFDITPPRGIKELTSNMPNHNKPEHEINVNDDVNRLFSEISDYDDTDYIAIL